MRRNADGDLIIVRHQPGLRLRQFLILLGFSVAAGVLGFFLGLSRAGFHYQEAILTRDVLAGQVDGLRQENAELKQELVKLERGSQIDRQSIREAKHTITSLENAVSQLSSDVSFYKSIMAPGDVETGLQVQRMELTDAGPDTHGYRLSLTQVGDNRSYISGVVAVNIIGQRNGEKEVLPLRDISPAVEDLGIDFRFRYFQDIEGELTLPEGFSATEVQVIAQAEGKKDARVERTFEWHSLIGD